jgi:tetratricopeptide (TPR) repeat protein
MTNPNTRRRFFSAALLLLALAAALAAQEAPPPVQPAPVRPSGPANRSPFFQPVIPQTPAQTPPPPAPQPRTAPAPANPPAPAPAPAQPARRSGPDALQNYRIGRDLEGRNRFDEANSYYNEAVRICLEELNRNGSNMDSYTVLTWSLLRQRRYAEVINWGDRALRINPNDYRVIETLGEAYFYLNDYEHSLIMLQRYTAAIPRDDRASTAYFFMGEIYRNQRKYLHADIAYTTAVTLEGSLFLWWLRLGGVREAAGEYAAAIEAYERALVLNPNYREAAEALERTRRLNAASLREQG